MILVDLYVPLLDKVYDFELEEDKQTGALLDDILYLITQKEGLHGEKESGIRLYAFSLERFLDEDKTLGQQGVDNGERLILV